MKYENFKKLEFSSFENCKQKNGMLFPIVGSLSFSFIKLNKNKVKLNLQKKKWLPFPVFQILSYKIKISTDTGKINPHYRYDNWPNPTIASVHEDTIEAFHHCTAMLLIHNYRDLAVEFLPHTEENPSYS